ncbi:tyrosine-type recombinase/integrase [Harryflintia acetispora]|uniref:tyrosine-type recombinase/integrase n=1 Tax=Harryflintia acetispora TaxID=1849041 RepID=UPI001899A49A|nr:tyrosine-type recombinase/integrase [Harryflintia acetispora]
MGVHLLTEKEIRTFESYLHQGDYAEGTIEKYLRDVRHLQNWLHSIPVTKQQVMTWRAELLTNNYAPATINSMVAAANCFFNVLGWQECRIKALRIQKRLFRSNERNLRRDEYFRLIETACEKKKSRLALLMETICATGIRVSEVKYITSEAVAKGRADIFLKGKVRTILLPNKLCRKLRKYMQKQKIASGEIFLTRSGKSISRRQIWAEMKSICKMAGVAASKVFPHNLRHLFALSFYKIYKDVVKLADVLGHSSIETTRIYLVSTGEEHIRQIERLGLIC